jgi:hypothetical protein
MEYTVISNTQVCGKINGEKLTQDDILGAGGSVEHLLASGHIAQSGHTPKAAPEVKEVPQVVKTPVFNSQEQGDK